jgi:hypothetical protein
MPLSKDPKQGGSEKDGSKSTIYCSLCYENGEFFYKGNDAIEFRDMVQKIMGENGYNRFTAWLFTRGIPYLPRWKK